MVVVVTERQLQDTVLAAARWLGWHAYHTHDSRRSQPGFPDLVLVRDRVLFRELKVHPRGRVSPAQQKWIDHLVAAGADAAVWWDTDWPQTIMEELQHGTDHRTRDQRARRGTRSRIAG